MQFIEHTPFIPNWAVIYFILALSLFAWIRVSSGSYMFAMLQSGLNTNTAQRLYREKISNIMHPSFRYNLMFYLTTGVFLLHLQNIYYPQLQFPDKTMIVVNTVAVFLFFNIKYLLYKIGGFIYKSHTNTSEYLFHSKIMNQILGVFMLPLGIVMFFTEGFMLHFFAVFGLLILLFISINSAFRGFQINAGKDISIYYLILYLCTLEILPVLLLWRIFQ